MDEPRNTTRALEEAACDRYQAEIKGLGLVDCGAPNKARLARLLQQRGKEGRRVLGSLERWMISDLDLSPSTAKRKRRLVWGCLCDHPDAPWDKVFHGHEGEHCRGVNSETFRRELTLALAAFAEFLLDGLEPDEEPLDLALQIIEHLGLDRAAIEDRIALREACRRREKKSKKKSNTPPARRGSKGRRP